MGFSKFSGLTGISFAGILIWQLIMVLNNHKIHTFANLREEFIFNNAARNVV